VAAVATETSGLNWAVCVLRKEIDGQRKREIDKKKGRELRETISKLKTI